MKIRFGLTACLLLMFLLITQSVSAAENDDAGLSFDPVGSGDHYSAVLYDYSNGLPTAEANDIAQTEDGFIWIGSYAGLIRYDGNTFERLDSTEGISSVSSLYVDKRDRLWIGTNDNGVAFMENGSFTFITEKDGLGSSKVRDIQEDEDGNIYIGTTMGITMITPDLEIMHLNDERISDAYIETMALSTDGLLYSTTNSDDLFIVRDGNLVQYYTHDRTNIEGINCILPDAKVSKKLYFGTEDGGVYYGSINDGPDTAAHVDISPLYSVNELKQIGNQVWVCARNGIGVIEDGTFHYLENMPLNNSIGHMIKDYEGNLWFTSTRQGMMKLVPNRFLDVYAQYDIPAEVVNTTCLYDDMLFVGTDTGLKVIGDKGLLESLPLSSVQTASGVAVEENDLISMLDESRIRSVIRDSKGRLWISTWRSYGLLRYDKGQLTIFDEDGGLLSNHVRAVYEKNDGSILVAGTGGISVIEGDEVTATYSKEFGIDNQEILSVCASPDGNIIAGSNGGGIYVINEGGIQTISKKNGLASDIIMHIKYDDKRGLYWLVTGNSIAYMTKDYKVTTIKKFPYPDNLDLYENSNGYMWVISTDGIYVVPTEQLIENKEITAVHYGIANGIHSIATSNSYNELTKDGNLYISGRSGVTKVNIEDEPEDVDDLKQAVPFVEADGEIIYPDKNGQLQIPASTQKLTVYAEVFTYSLTDPQVTYQLKGFDRVPVTVRRSDLGPVIYTNLPGGSYKFEMELKDARGQGSNTLSVPIIKKKAIYEQGWMYVVLAVAAGLIINLLVSMYMRRKMRDLEIKHRKEAEEERIGNELHMASQIQGSILPHEFPPFPERKEFDIYATMDPAREVGGDFYDFFMIDDDHLGLVIADVSGKGIPASLFMMNVKVIVKSYAMGNDSPAEVLEKTNKEICSNNLLDMFVTVWLGILEISSGKIVAANAGHEYPVIGHHEGGFELIKDKHGFVLGGMDDIKYQDYELQLEPGDRLFVYTDGLPEATNANNEMFGTERMLEALNSNMDVTPEELLKNIRKAVSGFTAGAEPFDDLTMLAMEYKGPRES